MTGIYQILPFMLILFTGLLLFMYLLYRHFIEKIEQQQRENIQSILEAQENERRTIALEVHDNLGPLLSITNMQVEAIINNTDKEISYSALNDIYNQLKNAIFICRDISHELTPFLNSEIGLQEMIIDYVQKVNATGKLQIHFSSDINNTSIHRQKSASLCRIILELITNTIKHAQAQSVNINFTIKNAYFIISYTDDGMGIQNKAGYGIGLKNINSRLQLLRGHLHINNANKGFEATIKIPLQELN